MTTEVYLPPKTTIEKILECHRIEINFHEKLSGFEVGRLEYSLTITSDIQEMLKRIKGSDDIQAEVEEVKALVLSVILKKRVERGDKIKYLKTSIFRRRRI